MTLKPPLPPRAAPVLVTPRLRLRPWTRADWPAYAAMLASPRAAGMGGAIGPLAAWGWLCAEVGGWALTGTGGLAIERDGALLGGVSFNDLPTFPEYELGWMLFDGHEGQGFATEAATTFRAWIAEAPRPASLVSYVSPGNAASRAVAERLGAAHDPAAPAPEDGDLVMRHWGEP